MTQTRHKKAVTSCQFIELDKWVIKYDHIDGGILQVSRILIVRYIHLYTNKNGHLKHLSFEALITIDKKILGLQQFTCKENSK